MSAAIQQSTHKMTGSDTKAYLLAAGTIFLWTLGVIIAKAFRDEIPLIGLSFWRWIAAVVIMLPFVYKELFAKFDVVKDNIMLLASQGLLLVGSSTLLFYSVNYTSAINATLVNAAQPVATGIIAWIIIRESFNRIQMAGIAMAAAGVILMIAQASLEVLASLNFNVGDLLLLVSITGYGLYSVNIKKLPHSISSFSSLTIMLLIGCVGLLPFYIHEHNSVGAFPVTLSSITAVVSIALLVSMLSMIMWNKSNKMIGPSRAAVFVSLMPLYGALMATTYLGEQLHMYHVAGGILICSGIFLVVKKRSKA